jgi:hypothetical protein
MAFAQGGAVGPWTAGLDREDEMARLKDRTARPATGRTTGKVWVLVACAAVVTLATACSTTNGTATTTTASTMSPTTTTTKGSLTAAGIRTMQEDLRTVGCYTGAIDGVVGPMTTEAIRSFQAASHLSVDGVYGPNTEGLLTAAAKAGARVCSSTSPSTTTTTAPVTTTTSASTVSAPCTSAAVGAALKPGETLVSYQCGNGWAAGSWTNSEYEAAFLLRSSHGTWVQPPTNACQNAQALGIPADVLNVSPCKVS